MAKKFLLVSVIAAFATVGAFAQVQMSAGAGFQFDGGRLGGIKLDSDNGMYMNNLNFGGFLFFDATYAELSVGFGGGPVNTVAIFDGKKITDKDIVGDSISSTALDIGLLGKYPIEVGNLTVAPLLGAAYSIVLGQKDKDGNDLYENAGDAKATENSNLRLQAGVGTDIAINDNLYCRIQGLAHYRFPGKIFKDAADAMGGDIKAVGGFGGTFTLAVGYKF